MAIFNPQNSNTNRFTPGRALSRGLMGGVFPGLSLFGSLGGQNAMQANALRAVQSRTQPGGAKALKSRPMTAPVQQTSAPTRRFSTTAQPSRVSAPAPAPTPAPAAEPVETTGGNLDDALARLEQVIQANAGRELSLAERERLVQSVASSRNTPELVGTEVAARFINAPGPSRREAVERESGVVTAEPAREQVEATGQEIEARLSEFATPEFELGSEEALRDLYDQRLELSDQELQARLEQIRQTYAAQRERTLDLNRQMQGGTSAFLGRAGAFSSASGQSAIQQAAADADARMASLASEEANALMMAQQAKDANDLAALSDFMNRADALRQERNSLAQQSFSNMLAAGEAERAARADEVAMASQAVNFLQTLTPDQLDDVDREYLGGLETQLNLPTGYFDNFATNLRAANEAATEEARFESTMRILDFAKDVPAGFQFQIGDEVYTGLKGGGGKSYSVQDGMGNTSFITIDEDTGQLMNSFTLPVGQRTVVRSGGGGGGFSGGGGGGSTQSTEQFIYLTSAREYMNRPISEFLGAMGVSPEMAASIVGDTNEPLTQADALSIGYMTGILPSDISVNDMSKYSAQLNPDYYVQRTQDDRGNDVLLYAPRDVAPSSSNVYQVEVPQQERQNIFQSIGQGVGQAAGFFGNLFGF